MTTPFSDFYNSPDPDPFKRGQAARAFRQMVPEGRSRMGDAS